MARRRKAFRRAFSRVASSPRRQARARRGRNSSGSTNPMMDLVLPSMAYGAVRGTVKAYAQPLTDKLPFGDNNDEIALGVAGYFLYKHAGNKFLKNMGKSMLIIESASLANNVVAPMVASTVSGVSSAASNSSVYNY